MTGRMISDLREANNRAHDRKVRLSAALIQLIEHFERVDAPEADRRAIHSACQVWAGVKAEDILDGRSAADPYALKKAIANLRDSVAEEIPFGLTYVNSDDLAVVMDAIDLATPARAEVRVEGAAEWRDNEPLKTDDTGCVTKRFVIFNRPGMAPEKKGGWLKDEHLIDFLREAMLLDCWTPGFRATVLELTWNNDLWPSSASEYLSAHDHAIGPRRARKAWKEAREKHERIYKAPPSMPLGQEIATYHVRTSPSPHPAADADRVREAIIKAVSKGLDNEWKDWEITDAILAVLKSTAAKEGEGL